MELTFWSFLLFLRKLVSPFRKRWNRSTRRLWYIFAFLRAHFSSPRPKKRDNIRRNTGSRPTNPPTTVICASRLPSVRPPLSDSPIAGDDTPASPTSISVQLRQPTTSLDPEGPLYETQEDHSGDHLDAGYLEGSGAISRSYSSTGHSDEHEYASRLSMAQSREYLTSDSPVMPPRPASRPPSQLHPGYRPPSQYSQRPPSVHSFRSPSYLDGAETAARGYLHAPPSPKPSSLPLSRPPSSAGSVTSQVYCASRPTTRVPRPLPIRSGSRRRGRSSTPASARHSVHEAGPEVPLPPQSGSRTSVSIHRGPHSTVGSLGPPLDSKDMLRPKIGINRHKKHRMVVIENIVHTHFSQPITTQFVRDSPENWVPLMHPEGALYWFTEEGVGRNRIYTDTDMCDPNLRHQIEEAIGEINKLKDICQPLPDDWELALELGTDDKTGEPICWYYFVHHTPRCLFWLHRFDLEDLLQDLGGVTEQTHIHLALQVKYWFHLEMFPHDREIPENIVQELTGILLHAGIDCMTSPNSTAAYPEADLSKLLSYVGHINSVGGNYGFSACIVGRLMGFLTHCRYVNFYGQKGARLGNDQTIYGFQPKRTYLIKILSILFFYAPEVYLRGLESVFTDFVICQHRWQKFITRLQDDWKDFILYSTVLLNANVAFLTIPSVDPGNHARNPVQLASYLSVITSIGGIVVGLLLLRQHRTKPDDAAEEVTIYLRNCHHDALGFETLATLYSLPYSLLLWSTIAFTVALSLEALVFSRQLWAKLPVGIVLTLVILLISWCVLTSLEAKKDISVLGGVRVFKERLFEFTRSLRGKITEPGLDAGDAGDDDGQGVGGMFSLREVFNRLRRPRRPTTSTIPTLINPTGSNNGTFVEMSDTIKEETRSEV